MTALRLLLLSLCLLGPSVLKAQVSDTLQGDPDSVVIKSTGRQKAGKIAGVVVPSLMVAYGVSSFFCDGIRQADYNLDRRLHAHGYIWDSKADNYLQFVPAAAAFTLKLAGVKSKNTLLDMTFIYALSGGLTAGIVEGTKALTCRERPDGSADNSFPSGHTATAFAAAEFLHREFGHHSVWITIGGYLVATMVGISRMLNDKHWLSDVVAGAGIGILATKAAYWIYPHLKALVCKNNGKGELALSPVWSGDGSRGLRLSFTF